MKKIGFLFLFSMLAFGQQRPDALQPHAPKRSVISSTGENCGKGAGNALKVMAIGTTIGCVIDLFITGGTLCMTYLGTAVANVPVAASAGCVVGAIANPKVANGVGTITSPHVELNPDVNEAGTELTIPD